MAAVLVHAAPGAAFEGREGITISTSDGTITGKASLKQTGDTITGWVGPSENDPIPITGSWPLALPLGKQRIQLIATEHATPHDHGANLCVGNVGEGIGVKDDQVGVFTNLNGAEACGLTYDGRSVPRGGLKRYPFP